MSTPDPVLKEGPTLINSVLCSTDFTEDSEAAFTHALAIALAGGASLEVLHAEPDNVQCSERHFPNFVKKLVAWGVVTPDSKPDVLRQLGMNLRSVLRVGDPPAQTILDELRGTAAQLLVMATHARAGVDRLVQPSVTEPVVRRSPVPTLVIPPHARGFVDGDTGQVSLRRILIPINHRPSPQSAVDAATRLATVLGCDDAWICTLYVGEPDQMPKVHFAAPTAPFVRQWAQDGAVVEGILGTAAEWAADLVVMATEEHFGVMNLLRGSTVERVLRQAPCPILVVPTGVAA